MNYKDGDVFDTGLCVAPKCTKVRVMGGEHPIRNSREKFWLKAIPVCNELVEKHGDGRQCNGCVCRCGQRELFIKFYTGNDKEIIKSMENQGRHRFASPYIAKTFGYKTNEFGAYVVMEYVKGPTLGKLPEILQELQIYPEERAYVLKKYGLIRQMLLCVKDYQRQWGTGVHMDLKPENFIVARMGRELQIKLVDFEGYTEIKGSMDAFVYSAGYAHPKQMECFFHGDVPIRVSVAWDFYAMGAIIYEVLEETPFFTSDELKSRSRDPYSIKKEIVFREFSKAVLPEEEKRIRVMIEKMMNLEAPWSSIENIIHYFQEFLDDCLSAEEIEQIQGKEYLKAEKRLLERLPYIRVGIEIRTSGGSSVYQSYDLLRGSAIPWYYGINIRGIEEDYGELLGYLYECEGEAYYFPIMEGQEAPEHGNFLKKSDIIRNKYVELEIVELERKGYHMRRKAFGRGRNI